MTGFEFDLTERLNINTEGYFKHFTQLTNINRNKLFPDNVTYVNEPDAFKKDFIVESGRAMGADVVVKYEERDTYLWFVYGLGKVDRWDGLQTYAPVFDRRHNVNLVASQGFGKGEVAGVGEMEFGFWIALYSKPRVLSGTWNGG